MVTLNVDLGELPDEPAELYELAHVAHLACGGHAGDEETMRQALALCLAHGAAPGAHPSYPDRPGFGRRPLAMSADALRDTVTEQCSRLAAVAGGLGARLASMKPHGALYAAAGWDPVVAEALVAGAQAALGPDVTVVGPGRGALAPAASRAGLRYAREGFADRALRPDGSLVARSEPGALLLDPDVAAAQALALARSGAVETLCVHGDTPGAVAIARRVRALLDALGTRRS